MSFGRGVATQRRKFGPICGRVRGWHAQASRHGPGQGRRPPGLGHRCQRSAHGGGADSQRQARLFRGHPARPQVHFHGEASGSPSSSWVCASPWSRSPAVLAYGWWRGWACAGQPGGTRCAAAQHQSRGSAFGCASTQAAALPTSILSTPARSLRGLSTLDGSRPCVSSRTGLTPTLLVRQEWSSALSFSLQVCGQARPIATPRSAATRPSLTARNPCVWRRLAADRLSYPELSARAAWKLKQLSLMSTAAKNTRPAYDDLQRDLELASPAEVERLAISCIDAGLLDAKLNQVSPVARRSPRLPWAAVPGARACRSPPCTTVCALSVSVPLSPLPLLPAA